jgi:F0F1-type ATP synthase beta subunit
LGIKIAYKWIILKGISMTIQEQIKEQLIKEVFSNIDNIYEFMDTRYNLDKPCNDAVVKKLNELKDVIYKVSGLSELN